MFKDKFKNLFGKKEGEEVTERSNKKKIENIVVFLILLIVTLIVINVIWNDNNNNESNSSENRVDSNKKLAETTQSSGDTEEVSNTSTGNELVSDLEDILSNINGVGKVKVMITYAETSKTIPVYNEESSEENTEETDSEGGTRKVTQTDTRKEVIYEETDNGSSIITQSIVSPTIEGAIITAEGANDATVKTNIIQAVGAVTGLATHKIQVFEMGN
mgnify:FL=1